MSERPVPHFPGYVATLDGEIVSTKLGKRRKLSARAHHRTGHLRVRMYAPHLPLRPKGGTRPNGAPYRARFADVYIHVAVCAAWHGPPPFDGAIVRHLDDDPTNNRPANLRWGTHEENVADRMLDDAEQMLAAEAAWADFDPNPVDADGFDWSAGVQT